MSLLMVSAILLLAIGLTGHSAQAQMDPTSAVLLRSGGTASEQDQLSSGRYTIRANESKPAAPVVEPKRPAAVSPKAERPAPPANPAPAEPPPAEEKKDETVTQKVRDLVLGGSLDQAENYREQVHEDDPRRNLIDIEFAPTFIYVDSSSNYWFRNYNISAPGFRLGAHVWITPFFGLHTSLINSISASLYSDVNSRDRVPVDMSWFEAGFVWRRYMGVSRKSALFTLGLDFIEDQIHPTSRATNRMRTKSTGVKVSVEATLPNSNAFAWQLGAMVTPRLDHVEKSSADLTSGTRDQTIQVGAWVGGLNTLDRSSQLYWRLQHTVERTLFEGTASTADPVTGVTPSGVAVTSGTTMLIFGYRWGN